MVPRPVFAGSPMTSLQQPPQQQQQQHCIDRFHVRTSPSFQSQFGKIIISSPRTPRKGRLDPVMGIAWRPIVRGIDQSHRVVGISDIRSYSQQSLQGESIGIVLQRIVSIQECRSVGIVIANGQISNFCKACMKKKGMVSRR